MFDDESRFHTMMGSDGISYRLDCHSADSGLGEANLSDEYQTYHYCGAGDKLWIPVGGSVGKFDKWPAMTSKFYNPFVVKSAYHPHYKLKYLPGRVSRPPNHFRRFVRH